MNKIYHSIWNEALGAWIAASEIAKGQGKRSTNRRKNPMTASPLKDWQSFTPLLATGLFLFSSASWALPTGEQLVSGQATVSNPTAGQMQIDQSSQNAIVNWQGFSIAPNETVNIHQPNAQAALLNRVVGADASQIQGQLTANGQVYLSNPNGVLFSKTAQVNVGVLCATTHDITNQDFMAGKNHFTQNGATGTVENQGTIKVPEGGVVALIGTQVSNTGTIETPKGTTALAAGKTVDLDFKGDGLVEVKVTEAALNAQIANKGAITADGGRVVLTAKAAGQLIDTVINQDGVIQAKGLIERNGEIILEGGYVAQTGTLDASGKTGGTVNINARAILDAGKTNADGTAGNGGKITMNARDDITLNAGTDILVGGNNGGAFKMQAGRNITLNSKIVTANGNFTAIAGDPNAIPADREAGTPTITLGAGATINAGTGKVILAAMGGNFNNNTGSTTPITAAQWLVYSTDPRLNARNGMVADFKHYAQTYTEGVTPSYAASGNWFLYSIMPVLTVTPDGQIINGGHAPQPFTYTLSGFIDGDTRDTAGIDGSAIFSIRLARSAVFYNLTYLRGLASRLGYTFADNSDYTNELLIAPPVKIDEPSREPEHESNREIIRDRFPESLRYSLNLQTSPLQVITTFLNWYQKTLSDNDDYVDYDYGQYKHDAYLIESVGYESRRGHGKHHWHEKHHNREEREAYMNLLMLIKNGGIKRPEGWIK